MHYSHDKRKPYGSFSRMKEAYDFPLFKLMEAMAWFHHAIESRAGRRAKSRSPLVNSKALLALLLKRTYFEKGAKNSKELNSKELKYTYTNDLFYYISFEYKRRA